MSYYDIVKKIIKGKVRGPKFLLIGIIFYIVNLSLEVFICKSVEIVWLLGSLFMVAGLYYHNKDIKNYKKE